MIWNGIDVTVKLDPSWSAAVKDVHGYDLAHFEIWCSFAYRSIFMPFQEIEGSAEDFGRYVLAGPIGAEWLAKRPAGHQGRLL